MYSLEQYFFSVGRFFYTDQYQSSMRCEGNAIQAPQDADLSLSLQVTPSSPKQVKHTTMSKYALTENIYIQRITNTSQ